VSWDDILKGTIGADFMYGGSGDDYLQGKGGGDTLDGGDGNDQLHGDGGDDHIRGGKGNDLIHGGIGTDTAYYSGSIFDYSYSRDGENFYLSHVAGSTLDGNDRLISIERLVFADAAIDLTVNNAPIAFNDTASTNEDVGTYTSSASVLANDFDWEGDALSALAGTFNGAYGTLVLNSNGTYTYTPYGSTQSLAQGQVVQDVFTYTVTDGNSTDTGTLTVSITGVNDSPVANPDAASGHENEILTISVLANDTDVDNGAVLTLISASAPVGKGTASVSANQVRFDPGTDFDHLAAGAIETVSLSYSVSDEFGATSSSTVTVTVTGTNDGPVANADAASTGENGAVTVDVLANDSDVDDGAVLTVTAASAPSGHGTASVVANQVKFDPGADFDHLAADETEIVVVSYTVSDEHGATSTSTVTVTVTGANDAPVASDDTGSASEDGVATGNVLANDVDVDGDTLVVANPGTYVGAYGTLTLAADGSYTYVPNSAAQALDDGEVVTDAFAYTASDGIASHSAALTISVTGANDAPVASDDSASATEDGATSGNVLANDTDVDGDTLTVTTPGTYVGTYGTLTLAGDGSYTYVPNAAAQALDDGEVVTDTFVYTASDGTSSDSATLTISVSGSNDAPIADDDSAYATEDAGTSGNVLSNDSDVDGEPLTVANPGTYVGTYGTLTLAADGSYSYVPNSTAQALDDGEVVSDTFAYAASDGTASHSATLTVSVSGANDAPVATDDGASATEDGGTSGNVLVNDSDVDGEPLTVANPGTYVGTYGTLTLAADGSYSYVPNAAAQALDHGEVVTDTFAHTASDGTASDSASLTVTVSGANDAPVANDDSASATEDGAVTGNVLANDTDIDGDALAVTNPGTYVGTYGTLTLAADGSYTFTPNAAADALDEGDVVQDSFVYTASDGTASDTATLTVTVTGASDGPQTIWYIDNSASGSSNEGTEANPFTSIAAFNAAQGSVDGPQAGATVYLLQGTGIYAEADGINLLDGQILIGVGQPTIAASAGDGIDLAQDNNVSGVDINVAAGNIGIDDDGGSVGNLMIGNVAISGSGQIVDIDNGGTLNVSLNSVSSSGSSGGAIDLAGVAGSFTVTGSTTISGLHSGGGVYVTGSSAAVSLTGGGLISTGGATAINYVGNSGSLALGGGLDIVTTSGAGLNASGGGTVTFTGAGNSIVATSGTAVTISGTTIGAAGVTLESVSSAGAVNTIVLANTGSLGGLSVTGTGAAASGGTVTGSTGTVILATDTMGLSLSSMAITGSAGGVLDATNLRGDSGIENSVIAGFGTAGGFAANAIRIVNSGADLDSFALSNTSISGGATANDGLFMEAQGTSNMRLVVDGSTFSGLFGDAVQVNGTSGATGAVNVTIENSSFVNAASNGNGGISLNSFGGITMRALVEDNRFDDIMRPNTNLGAITLTNGGTATAHYNVLDNVIEDLPGARGISFTADGTSASYLMIDGNSIDRLGTTTKLAINVGFVGSALGDVTISDNLIGQNGNLWTAGTGSANAILVNAQNSAQVDVLLDGNDIAANSGFEVVRVRSINAAVMNATVTGNTIRDTAGADLEFDASAGTASGTAVVNLNMFGNLFTETDADVIRLNDAAGGVLNVTQTSAANLSSLNDAATVAVIGTVFYSQPAPPLPVVPDFPM